jgi:acyl-CoA dehydrogenase
MPFQDIKFGLFADAPDLVTTIPALGKLDRHSPVYIRTAEDAQVIARGFARKKMLPKVLEIDEKCGKDPRYFDWDLWKEANDIKLTISPIPEKMGGLGWNALANAVLVEELASVCLASASNITFNTFGLLGAMVECRTGVVMKIIHEMVDAQKKGTPLFWSWAITEPSAGTDMEDGRAMATMRPSTLAKKVPGGFKINGRKCFITNGSLANYVIANIPFDKSAPRESMATFLILTDTRGFSVGTVERKCGQKASQTAEIVFEDVFVPEENLWEPPGRGLRHTREILSITRGFIGVAGLGLARGALTQAINFASHKKIRDHRLIDEEWVQFIIADLLKEIMTVRHACYNFAIALDTYHVWRMFEALPIKASLKILPQYFFLSTSLRELAQTGIIDKAGTLYKNKLVTDETVESFVKHGSAVKVAGTDLAVNVINRVVDIVGLEGMSRKHGIEKFFRDAKITQIYEGTNQASRIDLFENEISPLI